MDKAISIRINLDTCIRCGHCAVVCPAYILRQEERRAGIEIVNEQHCIECGQCAAICPTDALLHGSFPQDKLHRLKRSSLPTPEQMQSLIRLRRSNRAFTGEAPTTEEMQMLTDAALCAPTATNAQNVRATVVRSPQLIREIADYTMRCLARPVRLFYNPVVRPIVRRLRIAGTDYLPELAEMVAHRDKAMTLIMHDAPTLLFFHSAESDNLAAANCNLAYQNASLMAESLGLGHFYLGFVLTAAAKLDPAGKLSKLLDTTDAIHAGMAVGKVRFRFDRYPERRPHRVREL